MRALLAAAMLLSIMAIAGCTDTARPDAGRRVWRGPTANVSSQGITTYERREIAQRVDFPTCILIGGATYRYDSVQAYATSDLIPPGLFDSGYSLDRWRLVSAFGPLDAQQTMFVTALGSTGIVAKYPRLPAGGSC
jgi:hypothetical protein